MQRARTQDDLESILRSVDRRFCAGQCLGDGVTIRWRRFPRRRTTFTYAHYRPAKLLVEVNVRLCEPDVPEYVLVSVVYHELLHHCVSLEHDALFVAAELRNPFLQQTDAWMRDYLGA